MKYRRTPSTIGPLYLYCVPTNPGQSFLPCPARQLVPLRTFLNPLLLLEPYSTIFSLITNLESMLMPQRSQNVQL
jgi:hypothetical protein